MTRTMHDHLQEAIAAVEEAKRGIEEAEALLRDAVKRLERPDTASRAMHDMTERFGGRRLSGIEKARAL